MTNQPGPFSREKTMLLSSAAGLGVGRGRSSRPVLTPVLTPVPEDPRAQVQGCGREGAWEPGWEEPCPQDGTLGLQGGGGRPQELGEGPAPTGPGPAGSHTAPPTVCLRPLVPLTLGLRPANAATGGGWNTELGCSPQTPRSFSLLWVSRHSSKLLP